MNDQNVRKDRVLPRARVQARVADHAKEKLSIRTNVRAGGGAMYGVAPVE